MVTSSVIGLLAPAAPLGLCRAGATLFQALAILSAGIATPQRLASIASIEDYKIEVALFTFHSYLSIKSGGFTESRHPAHESHFP
jgi:hypothetical protein